MPQLPDDVPADCFWDLRTTGNKLAVYEIEHDDYLTVERLVAALMLAHRKLQVIDFAWVEKDVVLALGVTITTTPAEGVADAGVSELHRDVESLTGRSLLGLAKGFAPTTHRTRYNLPTIKKAIKSSMENDWIAAENVPPDILKYL